ncbi:MAG: DUF2589 domain-containing protein [Bacteroidetes bacterium]|nr:MAG: DUF2589 domain-containing protein [Bacteroidota bacterium]
MLNIKDFINALHTAVLSANNVLADANLQLIEKYFEVIPENTTSDKTLEELRKDLEDSLAKASTATDIKSEEALKNILDAFGKYQNKSKQASANPTPPQYRAKNVVLQYPDRTATGVEMRNINVPLIALVPITMSEISEVKFKTSLEILYDGNEIKVGFPPVQNTKSSEAPNLLESKVVTNATLEITLAPHRGTHGMQKLIEGYEQVLRSQLPH